jgi:CheY-like chemotaxis protein
MNSSSGSILLVEDDPYVRDALAELLAGEGYEVEIAEDGQQAIDLLEDGVTPNLFLIDLALPRVTGTELLRYVHDDVTLRVVPMMIMTALPKEDVNVAADEIISKPMIIPQFLGSVRRLIAEP